MYEPSMSTTRTSAVHVFAEHTDYQGIWRAVRLPSAPHEALHTAQCLVHSQGLVVITMSQYTAASFSLVLTEQHPLVLIAHLPLVLIAHHPLVLIAQHPLVLIAHLPLVLIEHHPLVLIAQHPLVLIAQHPLVLIAQHPHSLSSRMSIVQAEDHLCTYQEAMQQSAFLEEEFPLPSPTKGALRRRRESRLRSQLLSFEEIREVEEEGISPTEEEKARKSFLQSLESLRRSSNHTQLRKDKLNHYNKLSLDSSDSDSTL
ncbi:PREDICTED: uncharacterized protein LOC108785761 [Nanorana parkeri]|uniref:uncharacterized protein LOC108785761 n=1 Tax=Nanorana parkeri TaxID=125878 RepID=UPI000854E6BC|nr:PREDICTED: uncharacterized protein LOC108785761 [Nanorana parkeri]